MPSKTEYLLPSIYRKNQALQTLLKPLEEELFNVEKTQQEFTEHLLPKTTPSAWILWLFWALGGEKYHRPDFTETHSRVVLSHLFDLYKTRGTVEGTELHVNLLSGGQFIRMNNAPDKCFLGSSFSNEERAIWERDHPEIRIYPYCNTGQKQSFFLGDCLGSPINNYSVFPAKTDALLRIGDYVELYDPKLEQSTPLNYFQIDQAYRDQKAQKVVEIRKKGQMLGVHFEGYINGYILDQKARERFYSVKLEREYYDEITTRTPLSVRPSLTPMSTYYREVREKGERGFGIFLTNRYKDVYPEKGGSYLVGQPVNGNAEKRIYKYFKLFDPDRVTYPERKARQFLGSFQIGSIPAHHAELYVDLSDKKIPGSMYLGEYLWGKTVKGTAQERIERMVWAGNLSRRAGCKITVSINARDVVKATTGIYSGTYVSGQYVPIVKPLEVIYESLRNIEEVKLRILEENAEVFLGEERVELLMRMAELFRGEPMIEISGQKVNILDYLLTVFGR